MRATWSIRRPGHHGTQTGGGSGLATGSAHPDGPPSEFQSPDAAVLPNAILLGTE